MTPTDTFLTTNGLRLRLRDWGGPTVTPAILLVHGLASNAHIWDLLAPLLADDFRVAAIDQRGHGQSDKPTDDYNLMTIAEELADAIRALGWMRPLVVGHAYVAGGDPGAPRAAATSWHTARGFPGSPAHALG
jgi:pimeloyl-ACP methyl ester carboxylesterase